LANGKIVRLRKICGDRHQVWNGDGRTLFQTNTLDGHSSRPRADQRALVEVAHSRSQGECLDAKFKVGMEKQEAVLLGSNCRDCGEVLDPVAARVEVLPSSKVGRRACLYEIAKLTLERN
jgi:hypothetical protein